MRPSPPHYRAALGDGHANTPALLAVTEGTRRALRSPVRSHPLGAPTAPCGWHDQPAAGQRQAAAHAPERRWRVGHWPKRRW